MGEPRSLRPPAGTAREEGEAPRLRALELMVVDDEADSRQLLAMLLRAEGAHVVVASSVGEAWWLLKHGERPDVLVSDIAMPRESGLDLVRRLRADAVLEDLPAVAVSSFSRRADRQRSLEAGFQAHLAKPIDYGSLVELVRGLAHASGPGP